MNSKISDIALDLGEFALDNEIEINELLDNRVTATMFRATVTIVWRNSGSLEKDAVQLPMVNARMSA